MQVRRSIVAYGITMALGLTGAGSFFRACAPPPPPASAPISVAAECTKLVNNARAAAGIAPVTLDSRLNTAASLHSTDQAQRQKMTHTGANGSNAGQRIISQSYWWSTWGENVAAGQSDCATVVKAWMGSSGHRANILNRSMVHIGMGAVKGANGVIYWTMDLAAPAR